MEEELFPETETKAKNIQMSIWMQELQSSTEVALCVLQKAG